MRVPQSKQPPPSRARPRRDGRARPAVCDRPKIGKEAIRLARRREKQVGTHGQVCGLFPHVFRHHQHSERVRILTRLHSCSLGGKTALLDWQAAIAVTSRYARDAASGPLDKKTHFSHLNAPSLRVHQSRGLPARRAGIHFPPGQWRLPGPRRDDDRARIQARRARRIQEQARGDFEARGEAQSRPHRISQPPRWTHVQGRHQRPAPGCRRRRSRHRDERRSRRQVAAPGHPRRSRRSHLQAGASEQIQTGRRRLASFEEKERLIIQLGRQNGSPRGHPLGPQGRGHPRGHRHAGPSAVVPGCINAASNVGEVDAGPVGCARRTRQRRQEDASATVPGPG